MKYTPILLILALLPAVSATIQLDAISTDPVIITAGDTVDFVVEYRTDTTNNKKYGDPNWQYNVRLVADDDISSQYLLITDSQGDDVYGTLRAGGQYSKQFSIKVSEDAPAAQYELQLQGRWYYQEEPEESMETRNLKLTVHRYGILLDIADINTQPQKLKAGASDAALELTVANSGAKAATNTQIALELPHGIRPATSSNANAYIGRIQPGETQQATVYIDIDEDVHAGTHEIQYLMTYRDESQNAYEKRTTAEIYIAEKPRIIVENATTRIAAGSTQELAITLRNTAHVAAEAIDARLLKESNQPFTLQTRSGYVGKLEAGESATIILEVSADRDASQTTHNVPLLIRAKGDSDRNDNEVYTYRGAAEITVYPRSTNTYAPIGILAVILALGVMVWRSKK